MKNVLWSKKRGTRWQEAFPLGNGRMGAMCYGDYPVDTIEISDITFFSGNASDENDQPGAAKAWETMRQLCEEEKFGEAVAVSKGFIGKRENYGTNLPVGKLKIRYEDAGELKESRRSLDLDHGVMEAMFRSESHELSSQCFVSNPQDGMFLKLESQTKKPVDVSFWYESFGKDSKCEALDGKITFGEQALETKHSDGTTGVRLEGEILVTSDGTCVTEGKCLKIKQATQIYVSVFTATDFGQVPSEKNEAVIDVAKDAVKDVEKASTKSDKNLANAENYQEFLDTHKKDVSHFMDRVQFTLFEQDQQKQEWPLEEHLADVKKSGINHRMTELLFQYGRYLLFSSSRENSPLPAHLQGVWNDNVACQIGWTCDMHLDINTQMNYWLSETGNLRESHKPLFRWMENTVVPSGRRTAEKSYGQKGWSADIVTNAWGYTAPYWASEISPCPTGGIWAASDFVEHFRYSQDLEFLKDECYPVIAEAVDFFLSYVFYNKDGALSCGPSVSPENSFVKNGETYYFSNGTTYEILMIRELFTEYLEICKILQEEGLLAEKDQKRMEKVGQDVEKLLPYRILSDGTLAEWNHDYPSADIQHRHTSHLLGLYPYHQITPQKAPELAQAAAKTIQQRMLPKEGWEDTGWARSMMFLYSSRLRDRKSAYQNMLSMEQTLMNPNFMVMHPPTRGAASFMEVYELDGNTGFSQGVIEMLLQCEGDQIFLLPCLPKEWPDGRIEGLCAYGNIQVSMEWAKGKLVQAAFYSPIGQNLQVCYENQLWRLELKAGEKAELKN